MPPPTLSPTPISVPAGTGVDENEEGKEEQYWLGNLVVVAQLVQGVGAQSTRVRYSRVAGK